MRLIFVSVLLFGLCAFPAAAQNFPTRPVRIVVPFPPGGPADMLGRLIAEKMTQSLGQSVLIENRGGAAGNIGAAAVARMPNDGHALLLNASSHVINGILYDKLPYDPIKDFTPVSLVAQYNHMLVVHPSMPVRSVKELVELAKAKPGSISVGNSGAGTPGHLAGELFMIAAGIKLMMVPYKGSAPATTDLLGGQIHAMFNNPVNTLPFLQAGTMRAIAVTGKKRLAVAPNIPTVDESGYPGFEAGTWFGLYGPAGMSPAIAAKLQDSVAHAVKQPDVAKKLADQAWDVVANTPAEFAALVDEDHKLWSRVIKSAGLKAN